jgi:transcriptional regulator with XRE-family HTH domain
MKILPERLVQARESRGIDRFEAAKALGVTELALWEFETGKRPMEWLQADWNGLLLRLGYPVARYAMEQRPYPEIGESFNSLAIHLPVELCGDCGIRLSEAACDWKVAPRGRVSCDQPLCAYCRTRLGPNRDLCKFHASEAV